jgi:hypothetical protein
MRVSPPVERSLNYVSRLSCLCMVIRKRDEEGYDNPLGFWRARGIAFVNTHNLERIARNPFGPRLVHLIEGSDMVSRKCFLVQCGRNCFFDRFRVGVWTLILVASLTSAQGSLSDLGADAVSAERHCVRDADAAAAIPDSQLRAHTGGSGSPVAAARFGNDGSVPVIGLADQSVRNPECGNERIACEPAHWNCACVFGAS